MNSLERLSVDEIKKLFFYDETTGELTGKNGVSAVYSINGYPYLKAYLGGKVTLAHRVCWAIKTGRWPSGSIDHINGNTKDNRIQNIRDVPAQDNSKNQKLRCTNKSGLMGVRWNTTKRGLPKWEARITVDGNKKRLGFFDNLFDAASARKSAENTFLYHENHGRAA